MPNRGIRPGTPLSLDDARRLVSRYVDHYNNVRLNSATGYIKPKDMLAERQREIHAERDRKLEEARKQRQICRQQALGPTTKDADYQKAEQTVYRSRQYPSHVVLPAVR